VKRKTPNQDDVLRLLELFGRDEGKALLVENDFEAALKPVLRVIFQSQMEFQRLGDDPAAALEADAALHLDVQMLRDDIRSVLDPFEKTQSVVGDLEGVRCGPLTWPTETSWKRLRAAFSSGVANLGDPSLALAGRYTQLVALIRIVLHFWATTTGMTADGFVT
jgi:hypothetical protein